MDAQEAKIARLSGQLNDAAKHITDLMVEIRELRARRDAVLALADNWADPDPSSALGRVADEIRYALGEAP